MFHFQPNVVRVEINHILYSCHWKEKKDISNSVVIFLISSVHHLYGLSEIVTFPWRGITNNNNIKFIQKCGQNLEEYFWIMIKFLDENIRTRNIPQNTRRRHSFWDKKKNNSKGFSRVNFPQYIFLEHAIFYKNCSTNEVEVVWSCKFENIFFYFWVGRKTIIHTLGWTICSFGKLPFRKR